MLNRRPKTVGTSRLVKVDHRFAPVDDCTSFYPAPLTTAPAWEIHADSCRCAYCN